MISAKHVKFIKLIFYTKKLVKKTPKRLFSANLGQNSKKRDFFERFSLKNVKNDFEPNVSPIRTGNGHGD